MFALRATTFAVAWQHHKLLRFLEEIALSLATVVKISIPKYQTYLKSLVQICGQSGRCNTVFVDHYITSYLIHLNLDPVSVSVYQT